jgi:hypothetical protein
MYKKKRAAIQLTMGFLVTLIIAIVVFILSLNFLAQFFKQAEELKASLDDQTKRDIENMLAGNARVAIPVDTKSVRIGETGVFGIGIKNTQSATKFKIDFSTVAKFIPVEDPNSICDLSCGTLVSGNTYSCFFVSGCTGVTATLPTSAVISYSVGSNGDMTIDMNKEATNLIAIHPLRGTLRGHYIFNIKVCSGTTTPTTCGTTYYDGTIHKIHVNVR